MRLFAIFGGLILLVLLAALIGPYFVDWGNYRDRFETEASRILGQEVRVEGAASARIIPFPSVTFTDVRVGPQGAANITIEEFSMDAELAPFLSGEILIFDMRLVSPVIRLDLDEQGRPIWDWPSQTPVDPAQITLENAEFTDGTLLLRDRRDNRQWDFVSLNGTAAADNLFGPWRVEGDGLVRGSYFKATIATGLLNRNGFSTKVTAELPDNNITVTTDGRVAPPQGEITRWYSGAFNLKPTDNSAGDYRLEGIFEADAHSFVVEQFRGDFGTLDDPYTINGSAEITGGPEPSFSLEAKGNQLNVLQENSDAGAQDLSQRLSALRSVLDTLPFPPIPGTVNLDLPALVAGDTTIRDLKLIASPERSGQGWAIDHMEAKLPGRTLIEGNGVLSLTDGDGEGGSNSFSGELLMASRQPSGLAAWLTDDVDDVIRLLPNAGFSANVELTADRQSFNDLQVILGDARFGGQVQRTSELQSLPSISINLSGQNPDLETINALSSVMLGKDGTFRILDHDVDVALDLVNADLAGIPVGHLSTSLRMRGERIEIDKMSIEEMFGASISATGTVVREVGAEGIVYSANWDAGLVAVDGGQFVNGVGQRYAGFPGVEDLIRTTERDPFAFKDMELNSVGSARLPADARAEASASISGRVGASNLSFTSTLSGLLQEPSSIIATLAGTVENEEATTLLSQAGFEVFPLRLLGAGKSLINLSGSLVEGMSARMTLETPDTNMSIDGIFRSALNELRFTGVGDLNSGDIEPWLDLFGYIFPNTGLGTEATAKTRIQFEGNSYTFSELSGEIGGNSFAGDLSVLWPENAPKITGELRLDDLDLEFLTAVLTGRYDLSDASGLFATPLYADHTVDLNLQAKDFGTIDALMNDAKLRLIYRDGALSLNGVQASIGDGTIEGTADLQNVEGSIILNGQLILSDVEATRLIPSLSQQMGAKGDLTLALTGNGKSIEGFVGSLTGSGVLSTSEILLSGVNPNAIETILKRADDIGYEITEAQIESIAQSETVGGVITIAPIKQPVSVTSGAIRAGNIQTRQGDATLSGSLTYDLDSQTLSGEGQLTYDAGEESVSGLVPEVEIIFSQDDPGSGFVVDRDFALMAGFMRQRALEREQARVEALQARLLEKQRFRRQVRLLRYERSRDLRAAEEARLRRIAVQRRQALIDAQIEEAERLAREAAAAREEQIQRLLQEDAPIIRPRADIEPELIEPQPIEQEPEGEVESQSLLAPEIVPQTGVQTPVVQDDQPADAVQDSSIFQNLEQQLTIGN